MFQFSQPHRLLWCLLCSVVMPVAAVAQRTVSASRLSGERISIDGRLTESAWRAAPVSTGMTERVPETGAKAPIDFEVRILHDQSALYVGITSSLEDGETPRSLELRRDSFSIWSDDTITLKFDVHLDQRTTIGLAFNAAGAQTDFIALNGGGQFRVEFDGVWENESQVENNVWTAEVRIPFTTLGLAEVVENQSLGFNVTRDHNLRLATYDWAPLPPEMGPVAATHYGRLEGIREVSSPGRAFRMIPYALMRSPGEEALLSDDMDLKTGIDLRLKLSGDLWGEVTVLTDFAEVDLDDALVNLTRFPLFLPEKRPFFLSGLDVFSFGDTRAYQLFYSRRIGLDSDGNAVPILGGVKLFGHLGHLGVGALTVITDEREEVPQTLHNVARLRYDLDGQGILGLIWASRVSLEEQQDQLLHNGLGFDASYRFLDNRLEIASFGALTLNETQVSQLGRSDCDRNEGVADDEARTETVRGETAKLSMNYRSKVWNSSANLRQVGCHFDPRMGFARRTDIRTGSLSNELVRRSGKSIFDTAEITHYVDYTTDDRAGRYLGFNTGIGGYLSIVRRYFASVSTGVYEDVVDESFELPNDREVAAGSYEGVRFNARMGARRQRNPFGSLGYGWDGGFYGGQRHALNLTFGTALGPHVRLIGRTENSWLIFPDSRTDRTTTFNGDIKLAFNPRLFADINMQANTVNSTGRLLSRLRWRYLPGSDIYLVYQEDYDVPYDSFDFKSVASTQRSVTLKLTYWYDAFL